MALFKRSKWIGWLAKLGFTLVAFWFVLRSVDFSQLGAIMAGQIWTDLIKAGSLIGVQIVLSALRWRLILGALSSNAQVVSVWQAFKLYYISVFFNNWLPGTVGGDVVRIWLAKSDRIPLSLSIHSVIIDRLIALVALILLVGVTLPWLGSAVGFGMNGAYYLLPLVITAMVAGWWCLDRAARALSGYQHIHPVRWLVHFAQCLRTLFSYPVASAVALFYAVLSHISFCLCAYVLARSLDVEIALWQCVALVPIVILITTLPISIGSWGVREASMVVIFGMAGVPAAQALMISLEIGVLGVLTSLPAAFLWIGVRRTVRRE